MTDILHKGQAWLSEKLTRHASRLVTYRRGELETTLTATIGKTVAEQDTGDGLILKAEIRFGCYWHSNRTIELLKCVKLPGSDFPPIPSDLPSHPNDCHFAELQYPYCRFICRAGWIGRRFCRVSV